MNKYKVEFKETRTYVIDVLAENEAEAKNIANDKYNNSVYYEIGDEVVEISNVYDVTNTDDPFNPLN